MCLYGSVRVFGFNIVPDQPPYHLFSPYSHCALTIEAVAYKEPEKSGKEMKAEAKSILRAHLVPRGKLEWRVGPELLVPVRGWSWMFEEEYDVLCAHTELCLSGIRLLKKAFVDRLSSVCLYIPMHIPWNSFGVSVCRMDIFDGHDFDLWSFATDRSFCCSLLQCG